MPMPKNPASYEYQYTQLFNILSNPDLKKEIELPYESKREAEKARLRFYGYIRSLDATNKAERLRAEKSHDAATLHRTREQENRINFARRFEAILDRKHRGFNPSDAELEEAWRNSPEARQTNIGLHEWVLRFKDRDLKYSEQSAILSKIEAELAALAGPSAADRAQEQVNRNKSVYDDYLKHKPTETAASAFAAAFADVPPSPEFMPKSKADRSTPPAPGGTAMETERVYNGNTSADSMPLRPDDDPYA